MQNAFYWQKSWLCQFLVFSTKIWRWYSLDVIILGKNSSIVRVPQKFLGYRARCCSSFYHRLSGQYWRLIQMTNVPYLKGILKTSGIWLNSCSKLGTIRYLGRKLIDGSILPCVTTVAKLLFFTQLFLSNCVGIVDDRSHIIMKIEYSFFQCSKNLDRVFSFSLSESISRSLPQRLVTKQVSVVSHKPHYIYHIIYIVIYQYVSQLFFDPTFSRKPGTRLYYSIYRYLCIYVPAGSCGPHNKPVERHREEYTRQ